MKRIFFAAFVAAALTSCMNEYDYLGTDPFRSTKAVGGCPYCNMVERHRYEGAECKQCVWVMDKFESKENYCVNVVTSHRYTKAEIRKRCFYVLDHQCYNSFHLHLDKTPENKAWFEQLQAEQRLHIPFKINIDIEHIDADIVNNQITIKQ